MNMKKSKLKKSISMTGSKANQIGMQNGMKIFLSEDPG